jgi:subtilisin family serine protease
MAWLPGSNGQALPADQRVWVQFQTGRNAQVKAALGLAGAQIHYEFVNINAIAATVPAPALAGLVDNPNVLLIEEDPIRELRGQITPYGIDMVQAPMVWNATVPDVGHGIKVGVIDTGVWTAHEDLAGISFSGDALGTSGWNVDPAAHGTHVVGTIVAANNDLGVIGVAPGVSIHMARVFDDGGAYSSTLVNAAYACQRAGATIINISLGGTAASATEEAAFQDIYNQGVLCIASAGNDGSTSYQYPASYSSVVSVGAVDVTKTVTGFSQQNDDVELAAPGAGILGTVPFVTAELAVNGQAYLASRIEGSTVTTVSGDLVDGGYGDYVDPAWAGKVVLVKRGSRTGGFMSFSDKLRNIWAGGGIGAIIYNNVSGGFSGHLDTAVAIPAIAITSENGSALLLSGLNKVANLSTISSDQGSFYAYYDGTSMAAPHVSGVAALVWTSRPTAAASQVRAALRASAQDLGVAGRDNAYGFGLVQASAAISYLNDPTKDTIAPRITSGPTGVAGKKPGTFTISWSTDELSDTIVTFTAPNLTTYRDATLTKSHSMSFTGQKGVNYAYTVSSSDNAGNMMTARGTVKL